MKHAILITAHNNMPVVRTAMSLLDDERFVFFLLIDRKSKNTNFDFIPELQHTTCIVLPRIPIYWGSYSQIEAEMNLIEAALSYDTFDYIHFLQNADLPLKSPENIDNFFVEHNGLEFLDFQPEGYRFAKYKVLCRHFFS